ncbi:MAG: lipid-binding SYLF domain-containing protein [Acidobacteriota bacterium]
MVFVLLSTPALLLAGAEENAKVEHAVAVLNEIMAIQETAIPPTLLQGTYGIAIFPNLIKAGFILGGRYGTGIMSVRGEGGRWSYPVFFKLMGGSIGWQIGAQATDVILLFRSARSLDAITSGKFTLGADASVAAGPVGRRAEASTDFELKAEILSYSRSRGLFAGVSLEGASIQVDYEANSAFYNMAGLLPMQIFTSRMLSAPPVAEDLRRTLAKYSE